MLVGIYLTLINMARVICTFQTQLFGTKDSVAGGDTREPCQY